MCKRKRVNATALFEVFLSEVWVGVYRDSQKFYCIRYAGLVVCMYKYILTVCLARYLSGMNFRLLKFQEAHSNRFSVVE